MQTKLVIGNSQNEKKYLPVAKRLREAREERGWSQQDAADKCSVSRVMWGKYESGSSLPGSDVFIWLAVQGIDIYWVLTGIKQPDGLSTDERALISAYRKAPSVGKEFIRHASGMARGITASAPAASEIGLVADYKPNRKAKLAANVKKG